ncbi:MAG: dTDP-4-dehydrorhamnose reductase [Betaproteobacteria bacterium]|jgi:dTDP-4-dehydrorhamnose reductase|nr:dTDP-4-dehydrorhamnose reductase [Betaproteobacteria bacterium]
MTSLEVWGGVECTVNRVGDRYFDQLERSGHTKRLHDLDRFAEIGIKTLRFPALWERLAPQRPDAIDWSWTDIALRRLRTLGIRPIVGFVHHGSGPRYTSLIDSQFAEKLAVFARAFADRYPWVDAYTPVNEPLTTARFSGLYGLWYPNARDRTTFLQILLNECRAITTAMREVRRVNPHAKLVQTEDVGHIYSTPKLAYQARFENRRRWLGLDLLAGMVDSEHELYRWIRKAGIRDEQLDHFLEAPCAPDILGINHYITSNRFLDERLERYPVCSHGGNEKERYADVEAVRVGAASLVSPYAVLREVWERYKRPLAVTEAHIGCTRDEQMRWFLEIWNSASTLRSEGADIRAVTAWSLLGAFDWDSLVTDDRGHYEPGAFDLRGPVPRPTALSGLIRTLGEGRQPDHPALDSPGWWHRAERVLYSAVDCVPEESSGVCTPRIRRARELLITGARGTLGRAFARLCEQRGLAYRLVDRGTLDIADAESVDSALKLFKPWAVINAAGYCRVDDAERDREACVRDNALGPTLLAGACASEGLPLVTFSSDLVFDGKARSPYCESDGIAPLGVYGCSKAQAEKDVLAAHPGALVVRTSAFFGPWDEYNFLTATLRQLAKQSIVRAASDMTVSPTYVPDLVNASLDLVIDGASGLWHLANQGATTWADFARYAASMRGYNAELVLPVPASSLGFTAPRPEYSALGTERGSGLMPQLEAALERYNAECLVAV